MDLTLLGLAGLLLLPNRKKTSEAYDDLFKRYAHNPRLAKAVAIVESGLDPGAVGDNGKAFGLMQLWFETARGWGYEGGPHGLLNPETNIYYATKELNHLIGHYGLNRGIMGYNLGETRLKKGGLNIDYLNRVLREYGRVTI